jgi:hypothetical protein
MVILPVGLARYPRLAAVGTASWFGIGFELRSRPNPIPNPFQTIQQAAKPLYPVH